MMNNTDTAVSNKTAWAAAATADVNVALRGDHWSTTDAAGKNWLYFSSNYGGSIPTAGVSATNNTGKINQWVTFTSTNATAPKYAAGQCTTTFRGGVALNSTADASFAKGWSTTAPPSTPVLTSASLTGDSLLERVNMDKQTWTAATATSLGAYTNECTVRRPWVSDATFTLKSKDTLKFKVGAYLAIGTERQNPVGTFTSLDLFVSDPVKITKASASTVTAAMVSALAVAMMF